MYRSDGWILADRSIDRYSKRRLFKPPTRSRLSVCLSNTGYHPNPYQNEEKRMKKNQPKNRRYVMLCHVFHLPCSICQFPCSSFDLLLPTPRYSTATAQPRKKPVQSSHRTSIHLSHDTQSQQSMKPSLSLMKFCNQTNE